MKNKGLVAIATIVAVVAVGGMGFAAFVSSISYNATINAGTLNIEWFGTPSYATNHTYNTCSASFAATTATVTVGALAPGDWCVVKEYIKNIGNVPGYFWENSPTAVSSHGSQSVFYVDNLVASSPALSPGVGGAPTNLPGFAYTVIQDGTVSIAPGGTVLFEVVFGLLGNAGPGANGSWVSFTATIAAEVGQGQGIP